MKVLLFIAIAITLGCMTRLNVIVIEQPKFGPADTVAYLNVDEYEIADLQRLHEGNKDVTIIVDTCDWKCWRDIK